jgi:hypothetical protein
MEGVGIQNENIVSHILSSSHTVSEEEKMKLRKERFNSSSNMTTSDASKVAIKNYKCSCWKKKKRKF